jgi:SSS family transporter
MALPMWTYRYDMVPALNEIFVIIFAIPIMVIVFLPLYGKIGAISIYEFLEHRYSVSIRVVGNVLFLLQRFVWMGTVIYVPTLVLNYVTGIPLWKLILLMGVFTTIYTFMGGMKAVIWVDMVQFFIMLFGIVSVLWIVSSNTQGGFFGAIQAGIDLGKIKFTRWNFTLEQPNTWIMAIGAIYGFQNYAADQVVIQRFLTAKSVRGSILSFLAGCSVNYLMVFLLYLVGAFLFIFYYNNPQLSNGLKEDFLYPHFINTQMPEICAAIVMAAIMAASMSCINAGLNSMAAIIMTDYYKRFLNKNKNSNDVKLSRILIIILGISVIGMGFFVQHVGTNILDIALYTAGWFLPPLSAVFVLGAMTRRTNVQGAFATLILTPATMITLWYTQIVPSWFFSILSMTVAIILGYVVSLLFSPPDSKKLKYCFQWGDLARKIGFTKHPAEANALQQCTTENK